MNEKRIIQIIISVIAFTLIICHLVWPDLKIDSVTVFLIIVLVVPWLAPVFKSFELPGGLKIEYHDLEKVTKELKESGLIKSEQFNGVVASHQKYSFLNIVDTDSRLALAGLRIEIESRLRDLAQYNSISNDKVGISQLTRSLASKEVLNQKEAAAILDVLPILNQAVHGKEINPATHKWVIEIGPLILDNLESRIGKHHLPDLIQAYKNRDGAQFVKLGPELSKQLIRSTDSFFEMMANNEEVFKDWANELESSTFTLFEAQDEIDELIVYSKYSKLKELMIQRTKDFLTKHKNNSQAKCGLPESWTLKFCKFSSTLKKERS